jgi:hypothetical protein
MYSAKKLRRVCVRAFATSVGLLSVLALAQTATAKPPFTQGGIDGLTVPRGPQGTNVFAVERADASVTRNPVTIPFWVSPYQSGGQAYDALMVGTDPALGSATTTVPVVIVPLRMVFARDGAVLDFPGMGEELAGSPLFTSLPYVVGTTQYLDAYRRADFWTQVETTSPDYHTLLGTPTILSALTLNVPPALGHSFVDAATNRRFAYVDGTWLSGQLRQLLASLHVDPRALAVFLAPNTAASISSVDTCPGPTCFAFGGYHGALINGNPNILGNQPPQSVNTYAYAEFLDLGNAVPSGINVHLLPVSHELLEWLDDPLVFATQPNQHDPFFPVLAPAAPLWTSPFYSLGCANIYEVADPLEDGAPGVGVPDSGHIDVFADAVFQSWFARQSPSTAFGGLYDLIGVFQSFSDSCS